MSNNEIENSRLHAIDWLRIGTVYASNSKSSKSVKRLVKRDIPSDMCCSNSHKSKKSIPLK